MIDNIWYKKTPYNLKDLAKIMEASYSKEKVETIQKKTFSPSTVGYSHGQCPRYWTLAFNGAEFNFSYDAQSLDNMQVGTDAHTRIQRNFEDSELEVVSEVEIKHEDPPIRGFVDLYIKNFKDKFNIPVEIKTTRLEAYAIRRAQKKPVAYHELQLLIYLYVLNERHGLIMYENKNDHSKVLIPVEMDEHNKMKVDYALNWMREVYSIYRDGKIIKNPYRKNAKQCKTCPIRKYCFEDAEVGTVDFPPMNYSEVENEKVW